MIQIKKKKETLESGKLDSGYMYIVLRDFEPSVKQKWWESKSVYVNACFAQHR